MTDIMKLGDEFAKNCDKISTDAAKRIETVLKYVAYDVRSAARRSIKAGGKTEKSKSWTVSKPGEPPRSHKGTLKNAIQTERTPDGSYIIGASKVGSSTALKTLEYGGKGEFSETTYSEKYVVSRRRRKRVKNPKGNVRPRATRPYRVYSKSNLRGVLVREYQYFYSSDSWERARESSSFQAWTRTVRFTETTTARVESRPYMRPALAKETTSQKMKSRIVRSNR